MVFVLVGLALMRISLPLDLPLSILCLLGAAGCRRSLREEGARWVPRRRLWRHTHGRGRGSEVSGEQAVGAGRKGFPLPKVPEKKSLPGLPGSPGGLQRFWKGCRRSGRVSRDSGGVPGIAGGSPESLRRGPEAWECHRYRTRYVRPLDSRGTVSFCKNWPASVANKSSSDTSRAMRQSVGPRSGTSGALLITSPSWLSEKFLRRLDRILLPFPDVFCIDQHQSKISGEPKVRRVHKAPCMKKMTCLLLPFQTGIVFA